MSHTGFFSRNFSRKLSARAIIRHWLLTFSGSAVSDSETPWTEARQASLSTNSQSLLKLMSIELVMPSNHLNLCCPLLLLPFYLSQHQGLKLNILTDCTTETPHY